MLRKAFPFDADGTWRGPTNGTFGILIIGLGKTLTFISETDLKL